MTITFDNPAGLLWLVAAGAITMLGVGTALWRSRAATRFADAALVDRIAPGLSLSRGVWRAVLLGGAACCLSVALMDPRAAEQTEEVTRRGADVMFVVDVSRSMLAEDASPNRLERARTFISDAIDAMGGDRAGLIDFAGVAAVRAPLTLNYDALKAAVDGLEPKDSRRGGSMLGDAIRLAAESFPTDDAGHAIVILSDGEDMGSDPVDAAREAAAKGIQIITVGIGDPREGARIPVGDGPNRRFLVHDGEEVWSRMDSATLRDVADATGGLYVPAATAQVELGEILTRHLSDLERTEGDSSVARTTAPLFQWPAGLALALLVIESMLASRSRRSAPIRDMPARAARDDASPAPGVRRARRRAPAHRATAGVPAAAIAAAAVIAGLSADRHAAAQVSGAPRAAATTGDRDNAPAIDSSAPGDASRTAESPRARRTVGRGQIDRAAFREAVIRANAAMKSGQYAEAAYAYADAMDADPTSAAAAYNRGVAAYRAGQLDEAASSFSEAATRGDAALAADAMFNQGNATYQSALKALESQPADANPAGVPPSAAGASPAQPDLKAATEAVSKALTHYKDAIAANPDDIDSRANAELAHTLLKRLEEMQQQQQNEQQQKDQQQQQQEQQQQEQDQQQQDGGESDDPQEGDGQSKSGGKPSDKPSSGESGSESDPSEDPQPKEGDQPKDPSKDGRDDKADSEKSEDGKKDAQQPEAGDSDSKEQDAKDTKGSDGELKQLNGAEQPTSGQKPPAPAQARAGEPVPGAPLTKSEAERLLQGVRDRAKQRMEAKERAERVRQVPAVRDW